MIKTVIHQPDFLPWLGFFDKISFADQFIVLDDVQFSRRGWTHRDKIDIGGKIRWLTVPVKKTNYDQTINKIEISYDNDWIDYHFNILQESYKNEKNYKRFVKELFEIYEKKFSLLIDFNFELLKLIISKMKIKTKILFSSDFNISSKNSDKIIDLLEITKSNNYITGKPSLNYLDLDKFFKKKIQIEIYNFDFKKYENKKINLDLSVIDYLMKYDSE
jgi:hypothetical protein